MDYGSEVERRFGLPTRMELPPALASSRLVTGEAEDKALNVWVRFEVQVDDGFVRAVRFRAFGCPHTIAAASWTAEWLEGRPADRLAALDVERLVRELAVPVEKRGKLLRIEDALGECSAALCGAEPAGGNAASTPRN